MHPKLYHSYRSPPILRFASSTVDAPPIGLRLAITRVLHDLKEGVHRFAQLGGGCHKRERFETGGVDGVSKQQVCSQPKVEF